MNRLRWVAFAVLAVLTAAAPSAAESIKSSVVKVYTVFNRPNYHEPWQRMGQQTIHGSGAIIDGRRILTNAHVVSDQTFVRVRRAGEARRYTARVLSVAHESDLALLAVSDPKFYQGARAIEIGDLPQFQDRVSVYGFPDGGDKLSITEGIVSRIEHSRYAHSGAYLLTCQIDAPINSGNSGGPVMAGGKLVGVAFQGISGGDFENIGYMIPAPVVRHFLQDMQDGRHDGTPDLGLLLQKLENPDFRKKYGMADHQSGILVNKVYPDSPAAGRLFPGDVLTGIEGQTIAEDGTIEFRRGERTFFGYPMHQKQIGETVMLDVWREETLVKVPVPLTLPMDYERLVPHAAYDRVPTYYIIGGLVFEPLTLNYLREYGGGANWFHFAPTELLNAYQNGEPKKGRRQVLVLVKVLADETNVGYHEFVDTVVARVNGRHVSTMADLVDAFEAHTGPFHVVQDSHGFKLVIDRKKAVQVNNDILKRYGIASDRSEDLR